MCGEAMVCIVAACGFMVLAVFEFVAVVTETP